MPLVVGIAASLAALRGLTYSKEGVEGPIRVSSSNVDEIAYDFGNKLLYVTFVGKREYVFFDVPENIWDSFKQAPSKGVYVHTFLNDKYKFDRI